MKYAYLIKHGGDVHITEDRIKPLCPRKVSAGYCVTAKNTPIPDDKLCKSCVRARNAKDSTIVWTLDPDTGGWHSEGRFPLAVAQDKQTEIQAAGYVCRLSQTRPEKAK